MTRNYQPREIDRMQLDNGRAMNFLPRLIACLVLADGEIEFRRKALERCGEVGLEFGTVFTARTLQGATEIARLYLMTHGRMVTQFAPSDAARIWHGGPHGFLEKKTIPYWQHVQRYFASGQSTGELRRMVEEVADGTFQGPEARMN